MKITRRKVLGTGISVSAAVTAGMANAFHKKEEQSSFFLPSQLTKDAIQASKFVKFTRLEFAGSTFWLGIDDLLADGVPHAWIGIYAPNKDGVFQRSLFAESWAAGKIRATVDAKTGILELRDCANSALKGKIVLTCNLKTIGTQYSIEAK